MVTLTQTAQITAFAQETDKPAVNAQACVLYCVDDGKVYFSVNENKKMKPASTTKLMTSLIAASMPILPTRLLLLPRI